MTHHGETLSLRGRRVRRRAARWSGGTVSTKDVPSQAGVMRGLLFKVARASPQASGPGEHRGLGRVRPHLDLDGMRQVRGAIHGPDTVLLLEFGAHSVDLPLVAEAIDDEIATCGGESFGRSQAETLRRSGDERAFPLEHDDCSL